MGGAEGLAAGDGGGGDQSGSWDDGADGGRGDDKDKFTAAEVEMDSSSPPLPGRCYSLPSPPFPCRLLFLPSPAAAASVRARGQAHSSLATPSSSRIVASSSAPSSWPPLANPFNTLSSFPRCRRLLPERSSAPPARSSPGAPLSLSLHCHSQGYFGHKNG
ncbi:Os12g0195000 [Oryza sativa Japonica Group]|uniref:Uncharacterized protein n=2 Tax=Oryza sativa subsp. japonica TaxID=39947 RepID=A0A8J8XVV3_ORYSJ|nr:hypothetical protein OsJ_35511 [Oryza sativa Japonica Group]BAT16233.1 Os12g0195000 [Oryza sativa Japonica Group]